MDGRTQPLSCAVCAKILGCFLATVDSELKRSMGKVTSLLEGDCPHVQYFRNVKYMHGPVPNYDERELFLHRWRRKTGVYFGCSYENERSLVFSTTAPMELVVKENLPSHPGRIRILDPQWIDDEAVRGWISKCDEYHGQRCKVLPLFEEEDHVQPLYLIDTLQNCLVQGSETTTGYVALSYTWGKTEILRNKLILCQQLRQPGIFDNGELARQIPMTIRNAFAVVRCLGQRYLWVDALCIVQDDTDHLNSELSQMHRIYASANFTIIAVDGVDANHGLRGFRDLTCPRTLQQEPVQLAASEQIMQDIKSPRHGKGKPRPVRDVYHDRAWTFQENLFSKRKLIFEKDSVRWQCQSSDWHEELLPDARVDDRFVDRIERWFHSSIPTLSNITGLTLEYNQKTLTFPEDAFSAFAGIQTMLHRTYPSGLIYGHPELFFDIAINWRPVYPVTRRSRSATSRVGRPSDTLPSWSWLGWAGAIALPHDLEFIITSTSVIDIEGYSMPVTSWYAMESPSSTDRRRIDSVWHKYKTLAQDEAATLPTGWRREAYDIETGSHLRDSYTRHHFPRDIPKYCYKHSTFRDESQLHWYPVPTLEPHSDYPLQPQTAFLFAQTSRAFLYAGKVFGLEEKVEWLDRIGPDRIQLLDGGSQFVGILQLHNNDDMAEFEADTYPHRERIVELVATCKGYTGKIFDIKLAKALAKETGKESWATQLKDCYYVLWIEWKDGVAYRRGSGAVTVEAWETQMEEDLVDLILG